MPTGSAFVSCQLIDAETGAHLWADQFDSDQGELLEMQDEIVTRLARALQIQLAAVEASHVKRTHPENPDAEELAMQCEATYLRWGILPSLAQADYALCERALEMDSRSVRALAILAVRSQARIDPPAFIQSGLESRVEIGAGAPAEQRAIGGAGRGCAADRSLR